MTDDLERPETYEGSLAPVTAFLSDEIVAVEPSAALRDVAATISEETVGLVIVGSAEQVQGVLSERDLVRAIAAGADLDATTAADLSTERLVWVGTDATIEQVATQMLEGYLRHVLVGDGTRLVGVVSMRDVIAALSGTA